MKPAGIVLCGGRSTRMGVSKAALPFGDETLLTRTVRLVASVTDSVVVVAAPSESPDGLPNNVRIVHDAQEGCGPLEGLLVGLTALTGVADAAFVTGCDAPLLVPGFVGRLAAMLGDNDAAVPLVDGFLHPLSAVYRVRIVDQLAALRAAGQSSVSSLCKHVCTRWVTETELREVDSNLDSLRNLNRPEDYFAALAAAGFAAPPEITASLQRSASSADTDQSI